jgi:hypothetical protein
MKMRCDLERVRYPRIMINIIRLIMMRKMTMMRMMAMVFMVHFPKFLLSM